MSRVVVLLLTCNRPLWAEVALRSVLKQTFADFTVYVRDNSSDDAVERVVAEIGDPRVRFVAGFPRGQLANFVGAVRETDEEILLVLHDDDWWDETLLARVVGPMLDDVGIDVSFARFRCVDEQGQPLAAPTRFWADSAHHGRATGEITFTDDGARGRFLLMDRSVSAFQATAIRRRVLDGFDIPPQAGSVLDLWVCYILFTKARRFVFVNEEVMAYRMHGGSVASSMTDIEARTWCVEQFLRDPALAAIHADLKAHSVDYRFRCALAFLAVGRDKAARDEFRKLRPDLSTVRRVMSVVAPVPPAKQVVRWRLRSRNPRLRSENSAGVV